MPQPAATPFLADALEANRAGVLTAEQRRILRAGFRNRRGNTLTTAAMAAVIGVVILLDRSALARPELAGLLALAAFAVAAALVLGWRGAFSLLLRDARAGRVEAIEGAIGKEVVSHSAGATIGGFAVVAGRRFPMALRTLDDLPEAGYVRVYYLPRSHRVVNLERLPDPALAAGTLDTPAALRTLVKESLSLNTTKRAEARATLATVMSALAPEPSAGAPPPGAARDPRPLEQAILGRWRSGAIAVAFSPDGAVSATLPGGLERAGHWSVDAAGRLHSDATGLEQADAWVAGDTLTLRTDDGALTFQRA